MTSTDRIDWDWQEGGTAHADLGSGFTATLRVVPDGEFFDPGDVEYTDHELENLEVYGVIATVYHDGQEIHDGSVWSVSFFTWTPWQETREYIEEIAADIISESPTASDLAHLLIGAAR